MKRIITIVSVLSFAVVARWAGAQPLDEREIQQMLGTAMPCPGGSSLTAKAADILPQRIPVVSNTLTLACYHLAKELRDKWTREDMAQWKRLANSWCSHRSGWIEWKPGTCEAGGPPPICPVQHWHRVDLNEAIAEYDRENAKVRAERQIEAGNAICSCAAQENNWERESVTETVTYSTTVWGKPPERKPEGYCNPPTVSCPPGYECMGNKCYILVPAYTQARQTAINVPPAGNNRAGVGVLMNGPSAAAMKMMKAVSFLNGKYIGFVNGLPQPMFGSNGLDSGLSGDLGELVSLAGQLDGLLKQADKADKNSGGMVWAPLHDDSVAVYERIDKIRTDMRTIVVRARTRVVSMSPASDFSYGKCLDGVKNMANSIFGYAELVFNAPIRKPQTSGDRK